MQQFNQLQELINSEKITFFMEAHNAISAKIVQECGFEAIWASGLTISASMGLRDRNEASWSQIIDIVEFMADSVRIPILMDGDTGFGNFNNVRRLVKKMCQKGIAGVCLEDKLYPKTNSFLGEEQSLSSIDEFCGKIMAAKDSQTENSFVVVARVEALVSGKGLQEALDRAYAYFNAGADAVLIHSKKNTAAEVLRFAEKWNRYGPLFIVPTRYFNTPTKLFIDAGISGVVWANHNMRASILAMQKLSSQIFNEQSIMHIENHITSLNELFALTNEYEYEEAEKKYLFKDYAESKI